MVRASDAVIEICGRIGTLNEFTVAFEDHKPIGVLLGTGGAADELKQILSMAKRGKKNIYYDTDPKRLVKTLLTEIKKRDKELTAEEKKNNKKRTITEIDEQS